MKKIGLILILISMSLIIYSCEDDALLMPQVEEECVGSYYNLSLPNDKNDLFAFNPEMY
tara:strand:- start:335 stop:511 length:177 start_codon:yes stop_codon:yes gene_type:complete